MQNQVKKLTTLFLVAFAVLITITSCGDDDSGEPIMEETSTIKLNNDPTLGNILTSANGVTLYTFAKDVSGSSACLGGCLDSWPIFYVEETAVDTGLESADFGTVTHDNGAKQTTYKGWPLYYYAPSGDGVVEASGSTLGDGVGAVWFVAKPDYTIMYANAQLVGNDGLNYTSTYEEGDGATAFFVNDQGRALYTFNNDSKDVNNFTASDFSNDGVWPVFTRSLEAIPSSLSADDFGTIDVFGRSQITYKGWPLYYFGQDTERGETKGVSVPNPGVWPVVNRNIEAAQ